MQIASQAMLDLPNGLPISAAMVTPFSEDGQIDLHRLAIHARALVDEGADGLTLFGTTGEGASISLAERRAAQDAVLGAGIPAERLVAGLSATAIGDAVAQAEVAAMAGIRFLLVPPPFYFRDVSEPAVEAWFGGLFHRIPADQRVVIYHIPQVTGVPLSASMVGRLKARYPTRVVAIKDSGGNWAHSEDLLKRDLLPVLVGDERLLGRAAALRAVGSISGMANLAPARLGRVFESHTPDADLDALVDAVVRLPVTPAVKALVAMRRADDGYARVRPPLSGIPGRAAAGLKALLDAIAEDKT